MNIENKDMQKYIKCMWDAKYRLAAMQEHLNGNKNEK